MRARAAAVLVPAILLAGSIALADRPRVVILTPTANDPIAARVRDELGVLGFDVRVEIDADGAELGSVARRAGAAAAARIGGAPHRIDLWVDPGPSGLPALQILRDPPDPALLALRAVELLRARLIPVDSARARPEGRDAPSDSARARPEGRDAPVPAADAPPSASPVPLPAPAPSARADQPAPPAKPRVGGPFAILAGPALLLSPGGVPAAFHLRFGAEWDPIPRVGIEAMAFVPATASTVNATEGSVSLRVLGFGGGIRGALTDPLADFTVGLGLGLQAMALTYHGEASGPWAPQSGTAWAASPYIGASAAYRFHPRLAVRLDLVASLVRPEPVVRIAGHDAASFGQPALFPSLDLEVRP